MDGQTPNDSHVLMENLQWTSTPVTAQYVQQQDVEVFRAQTHPHQNQLPDPDFHVYPQYQQFRILNSSITAANDHGLSSSMCLPVQHFLCSMWPGDVHPTEAKVCTEFTKNQQHFEEGSIDNYHLTNPVAVLYNANQSGQFVLMNPEPGPMFATLENASLHRNDSFHQVEAEVTTLPPDWGASAELELLHASQNASNNRPEFIVSNIQNQVALPPVSIEQTADEHHQDSVSQVVRNSHELRSKKPCSCTKSMCLKLYCECFSNGVMCNNCNCTDCHNNPQNEAMRGKAMKSRLVRNPNAFKPKISGDVKRRHYKGCHCKRSGCLKNYCECFEANVTCTPSCKCVGCRNCNVNLMDRNLHQKDQASVSVITPAVVDTATKCLLARAAKAEREQCTEAWAQHEVLTEFGNCLTQIVKNMFN